MKKILFGVAALGLLGLAGAGVGLRAQGLVEAKATSGETYYLVGESAGSSLEESSIFGAEWNTSSTLLPIVDGSGYRDLKLKAGDQFKYMKNNSWEHVLGGRANIGSASGYIDSYGKDGNVHARVDGTYRVSIKDDTIYVDLINPSTVDVYVQVKDWENTYLYAYDETTNSGETLEPLGAWPGAQATSVTQGTNAKEYEYSYGGIAKFTVPYINLANTKLIVNNNDGQESGKQPLASEYFYWNSGVAGNEDFGLAAKFIYESNMALQGATASSLCNVTKSVADEIIGLYPSTNDRAKNVIATSTVYTYGDGSTAEEDKTTWTYKDVYDTLVKISNGTYTSGSSPVKAAQEVVAQGNGVTILSVSLVVSALGLIGFAAYRRRKAY